VINCRSVRLHALSLILFAGSTAPFGNAQTPTDSSQAPSNAPQTGNPSAAPGNPVPVDRPIPGQPATSQRDAAAEQLKQQEHQRILGVIPNFNTSYLQDAHSLSAKQKFHLMLKSSTDPVAFAVAALDAGYSQLQDDFPGYGQGVQGYGKRFGAAYADSFDGALWGNAILPSLLHQDPRYFRKGTGTIKQRLWYAISTTIRAKGDNGKWQPNYSNVLGNVVSGGIANLYYPESDRGAGLTFQRAFTVTAEGAVGSILVEFWPDISRRWFHKKNSQLD
jgi:hypothetical protein